MGEPSLDDANVKVAVRVRPMNRRGERASQLISGLLHEHTNYCCNADCIFPHQVNTMGISRLYYA